MNQKLTSAKMKYANIEREMLAVVFRCLKYHQYLYGRRFVCMLDHQTLENVLLFYEIHNPDYKGFV